ncbi:MAG TPA: MoxR family ATPase [Acidimicrobiales bacterium]|nr:MoxR family ATPase [Acidimicrobiales bacterium]
MSGPAGETTILSQLRSSVRAEVAKVVVGQTAAVDAVLAAACVGGHVLLEGAPGVAKTLLASSVARTCNLEFRRIQFTPDMLPSDVTGTLTLRGGELSFRKGPVFTNILLADEINRTPPKTQAALLEAMQEGQVTIEGERHELPRPFVVIATENPIEYEGTYPLPEAQLDRFLLKVPMSYPSPEEEAALLTLRREGLRSVTLGDVSPVVAVDRLLEAQAEVDATTVTDAVVGYVAALVRRTRELPAVRLGASPRAGVHLLAAAKAAARLANRSYVVPDDVVALAPSVLGHRLVLRAEAELDRFTTDDAVRTALQSVPVPR